MTNGRSPKGSGSRPTGRASKAVSPVPASIPSANGCQCRLCLYDEEFAEHLARIPASEHAFFEELKERWEHADFDAEWYRTADARAASDAQKETK